MSRLDIHEEARAMSAKREAYDLAKKESARLEKEFKAAQSALYERMEDEGIEGIKIDGVNYVPAETMYSSINDLDAFTEWAQENAPELLKLTANKDELNREIRRCLDDGDEPPPGTAFYIKEYVSQRAA